MKANDIRKFVFNINKIRVLLTGALRAMVKETKSSKFA